MDPSPEPAKLGNWRIIERLGRGASSVVFRAQHSITKVAGAAKVLTAPGLEGSRLERFRREAELAARLRHPHLVTALDAGQEGPYHYLIYEYVEGENLGQILSRVHRLEEGAIVTIGIQLASALCAVHGAHMIHRDIKPENILIDRYGAARLVDLGIGKDLQAPAMTMSAEIMGTPYYMAPEQAQASRDVDQRADIYSLGATLYHATSGETPFRGDSVLEVMQQHASSPLRPLRELCPAIDPELAATIERMLAKAPGDRFSSSPEVLQAFERVGTSRGWEPFPLASLLDRPSPNLARTVILQKKAADTRGESPGDSARTASRRRFVVAGIAGSLAAATAVALIFLAPHLSSRNAGETSSDEAGRAEPSRPAGARHEAPAPKASAGETLAPGQGSATDQATGLPQRAVNGRDKSELVLIPAGTFMMGDGEASEVSGPPREVSIEAFYLGRTEVTNAQYRRFVSETMYPRIPTTWTAGEEPYPPEREAHPVAGVSWDDAVAYVRWAGLRLPSEAEWEWAARGPSGFLYPWGNAWEAGKARDTAAMGHAPGTSESLITWQTALKVQDPEFVARGHGAVRADDFEGGASPFGCLNMAGNVAEWTSDRFAPYPGSTAPASFFDPESRTVRGTSWFSHRVMVPAAVTRFSLGHAGRSDIGFRVAADAGSLSPKRSAGP